MRKIVVEAVVEEREKREKEEKEKAEKEAKEQELKDIKKACEKKKDGSCCTIL